METPLEFLERIVDILGGPMSSFLKSKTIAWMIEERDKKSREENSFTKDFISNHLKSGLATEGFRDFVDSLNKRGEAKCETFNTGYSTVYINKMADTVDFHAEGNTEAIRDVLLDILVNAVSDSSQVHESPSDNLIQKAKEFADHCRDNPISIRLRPDRWQCAYDGFMEGYKVAKAN